MLDFDFLEVRDIFDGYTFKSEKLTIFNDFTPNAEVTDYSILLGASHSFERQKECGWYYLKTPTMRGMVNAVSREGYQKEQAIDIRWCGARPVINYSKIKSMSKVCPDRLSQFYGRKRESIEIEFGEYPQTVVSEEIYLKLEELYKQGKLNKTGKVYTCDKTNCDDYEDEFTPLSHYEYEYNGDKYIRFEVGYNGSGEELSTGMVYYENEVCYVKVEPVRWLVDEKSDIAVSKKILFAGIKFSNDKSYMGYFESTAIKIYMDLCFSQEIIPSKMNSKEDISYNPYNFDFSNVSEEEIIKGCVEANIAVMLHGKSGDGKSARVKELDSEAEILYLINASSESLCGKSIVLPNGEMKDIPPTWYTKLEEKCKKEPDKIHIVFFDEITNAPPSIQGMAFNIILDKEVNGKWELPKNARIVAAGNEYSESKSAYDMSEPLFNRFAHVYIDTKVEDFLKWASTPVETYERLDYKETNLPMKIHPSIYAFIAYKSYKGEDVLRSKFDGVKPNADPRKWEMASKVLYTTGNPEMLRSLVGEAITREFAMFCQQRVITVEDILSGNYTDADLDMNTSEKYNTAVGLSSVGMEHFEKIREFVKRLGPEICATFETLWAHGMEERLEKIQEIKLSERIK